MQTLIDFFKSMTLSDLANLFSILTPLFGLIYWLVQGMINRQEDSYYGNSSNSVYTVENLMKSQKHKKLDESK